MKAFLINPHKQTITELDYSGHWQDIASHIDAPLFTVVRVKQGDIFLDDEGLYSKGSDQMFFLHKDYPSPLAGYGLVLDTDEEGETIASTTSIEELSKDITWLGGAYEAMQYAKVHNL